MDKVILVTGFGPFRDYSVNPSWEAVKLLPDELEDYKLVKMEIPVAYESVESLVPKLWNQLNPEIVIHVGVSAYTAELKLEQKAHRLGYHSADCTGKYRCTGSVCSAGDDCILTGINIDRICKKINEEGIIKASPSLDAGRYLCEFTYYTSLNIDKEKVLFVHVPPEGTPYSINQLSEGVLCIIKAILEDRHSCLETRELVNNVSAVL